MGGNAARDDVLERARAAAADPSCSDAGLLKEMVVELLASIEASRGVADKAFAHLSAWQANLHQREHTLALNCEALRMRPCDVCQSVPSSPTPLVHSQAFQPANGGVDVVAVTSPGTPELEVFEAELVTPAVSPVPVPRTLTHTSSAKSLGRERERERDRDRDRSPARRSMRQSPPKQSPPKAGSLPKAGGSGDFMAASSRCDPLAGSPLLGASGVRRHGSPVKRQSSRRTVVRKGYGSPQAGPAPAPGGGVAGGEYERQHSTVAKRVSSGGGGGGAASPMRMHRSAMSSSTLRSPNS